MSFGDAFGLRRARVLVASFLLFALASFGGGEGRAGPPPPSPSQPGGGLDEAEGLSAEARRLLEGGKYAEALRLAERALAAREAQFGGRHAAVAASENQVGEVSYAMGDWARAEVFYRRALGVREALLGPDHPDVAETLNNLAVVFYERGLFARAEPLYLRALAIEERAYGKGHPNVAQTLNNLAWLYRERGELARAEPLLVRALAIREGAKETNVSLTSSTRNNLAMLYHDRGAYAQAEPLYLRSLAAWQAEFGPDHPLVGTSLNNLAMLYHDRGEFSRALPLYERALGVRRRALGPDHPLVAESLLNMASLYGDRGEFDRAEALYGEGLAALEKALGPSHPRVAVFLFHLGQLSLARGDYGRAGPLLARAFGAFERSLGRNHPRTAAAAFRLALLAAAVGDGERALERFEGASASREAYLRAELGPVSEPQKLTLLAALRDETHALISWQASGAPPGGRALRLSFEVALQRKGRALDALAEASASLHRALTPALRAEFEGLFEARAELGARLRAPEGEEDARAVAALRERVDRLEGGLLAASSAFRAWAEPVTLERVRAALPAGSALIEFVRYRRYDFRARAEPWGEERYVAYLLRPEGPPRFVDLGEASLVDRAVREARASLTDPRAAADAARGPLRRLDALALAPVRRELGPASHLFISPDGALNLVPFEALVDEAGRYLLETTLVTYLTSGRDLVRLFAPRSPRSGPLVVAGPDYGPGGPFFALPGAAAEADEVRRRFPRAGLLDGPRATKAGLARATAPAFLHIATHGFSRKSGGAPPAAPPSSRGLRVEGVPKAPPPGDDPSEALDLSGLALAGANRDPGAILSARELAGLDLWGTELVVLSACESGVGRVASGEGVYGLRRALVVAGAASQVTSLWDVSDEATRRLMGAYYDDLARGRGRSDALRRAKLETMREPQLAHPFYWAAFVPSGDFRPLGAFALDGARASTLAPKGACACRAAGAEGGRGGAGAALTLAGLAIAAGARRRGLSSCSCRGPWRRPRAASRGWGWAARGGRRGRALSRRGSR